MVERKNLLPVPTALLTQTQYFLHPPPSALLYVDRKLANIPFGLGPELFWEVLHGCIALISSFEASVEMDEEKSNLL